MARRYPVSMLHLLLTILVATYYAASALPVEDQAQKRHPFTEEELDAQWDAKNNYHENFDPQKADASGKITCFGTKFDLELPLQQGWNPNDRSYQQICAKPQYGGGPVGQHVGGWCSPAESGGVVAFDDDEEAKINTQLFNPRVLLGCRYRCFCSSAVADPAVQPKPDEPPVDLLQVHPMDSALTYQISLDVNNDFTMPMWQHRGLLDTDVDAVRNALVDQSQPDHLLGSSEEKFTYVSEDEGNKLTCSGALPTFVLPPPYNRSDFKNNQQLCAIQLNGGLFGANAGGYCHRNDDGTRTPWFADDMTPRPDWTWTGGLFAAAATIRFHCIQHCQCEGDTAKTPFQGFWLLVDGMGINLRNSDGSFTIDASATSSSTQAQGVSFIGQGSSNKKQKTKSVTVLPPQHGNNSASGTCGPANNTFCPSAWPTDLLGPIPLAPPNATQIVRPHVAKGSRKDMTVCGNQCSGPQDCRSPSLNNTQTDHACTCAFPNPQDAHVLGLDPVSPVSVCLVLMRAVFASQMSSKGNLNGRAVVDGDAAGGYDDGYGHARTWTPDGAASGEVVPAAWENENSMVSRSAEAAVGRYVDGEGLPWQTSQPPKAKLVSRYVHPNGMLAQCRCNATFTHNECCGMPSGMVWLDPSMEL